MSKEGQESQPKKCQNTLTVEPAIQNDIPNLAENVYCGAGPSPYGICFTLFRFPLLHITGGWPLIQPGQTEPPTCSAMHSLAIKNAGNQKTFSFTIGFIPEIKPTHLGRIPQVDEEIKNALSTLDLTLVNLETGIRSNTADNMQLDRPGINFIMSWQWLQKILNTFNLNANHTIITIANNHVADGIEEPKADRPYLTQQAIENTQPQLCQKVIGLYNEDIRSEKKQLHPITIINITNDSNQSVRLGVVSCTTRLNKSFWENQEEVRKIPVFRMEDILLINWNQEKQNNEIDILVLCVHWGREQTRNIDAKDEEYAKKLSPYFDIIFVCAPPLSPIISPALKHTKQLLMTFFCWTTSG
jgi:hypothetical protein